MSKAIVISFDRWHVGFLGLSGNPWVDTPALDAFAVQSAVFDQHFAENLSPVAKQHAWWTGRCQFPLNQEQQAREPSWLDALAAGGITSSLLYDPAATVPIDPMLFSAARAVPLDDAKQLHFEEDAPRFVKTALHRIHQMGQRLDKPELLWLHAGGLPIDEFSEAYAELYADDVPPSQVSRAGHADLLTTVEDQQELASGRDDDDHDEVLGGDLDESNHPQDDTKREEAEENIVFPPRFWRRARSSPRELADASLHGQGWQNPASASARSGTVVNEDKILVDWQLRRDLYSGQVTRWDAWVGKIIHAALKLAESTSVMIVFTAAAGEHLGEHSGTVEPTVLFEETIHVPLLIHVPQTDPFAGRRLALTNATDLPATILDWFQVPPSNTAPLDGVSLLPVIRDDLPLARQTVFAANGSHGAARTPEFYYRRRLDESTSIENDSESVFVKPDDRWDADNMIRQLPDAADELRSRWQGFVDRVHGRSNPGSENSSSTPASQ